MKICLAFTLLLVTAADCQVPRDRNGMKHSTRIVFVCEHGAALSVVSAAYFNKIAREEHLQMHAIARGITPQKGLAVSARDGLKTDGVPFETRKPQALSIKDAAKARRIVAFSSIPSRYMATAPVETWDDVPPTAANYGLARNAILKHLRKLIQKLKAEDEKEEAGNR